VHLRGAAGAAIEPGQGELTGHSEFVWLNRMDAAPRQVSVRMKYTNSGQMLEESVVAVEMVG